MAVHSLRRTGVAALCALAGLAVVAAAGAGEESGPGDAARGARSWAENCARCHNMRQPGEFRDDLWRPIVAHMRVRGGLTGQQARDILAFLQASNFTAAASAGPVTAAAGAREGEAIYRQTCIACHGADGRGALPGVPDLRTRLGKPDAVLIAHIRDGFQSPGSALAMPPRGGNAALTDADIAAVLRYVREQFGR